MKIRFIGFLFLAAGLQVSTAQTSQSCYEDLFPKQSENKFWGYVTLFDEWKVEPVFTKLYPFTGDKAVVEKYGRYGVVNCQGRMVIPADYEEIGPLTFSKKFWAKKAGKWGLIDEKGETTAPGNITDVKEVGFNTEVSWLKTGEETYGLYDKKSMRFLAAPRYTMFQVLSEKASIVQYKERFGIVSHTDGSYLFEPVITSLKKFTQQVIVFEEKGKWGILAPSGEVKKVAEYDSIGFILNNLYYVSKSGKSGLIDATGKEILPLDYEEVNPFYEHMSLIKRNGAYGYTTLAGKVTVPVMYEWGGIFQNDFAIVKTNAGYFLVDKNNKKVTSYNYKWLVKTPGRNYYAAFRDGKYLFLDMNGKELTAPSYAMILPADTTPFVRVQPDSLKEWSFYDATKAVPAFSGKFEETKEFKGMYAFVKSKGAWGAIDQKGIFVVPARYQQIQYVVQNNITWFVVEENGKKGLLNNAGAVILPSEYDLIDLVAGNLIKTKKADKFQVMNLSGDVVLKTKYDFISNKLDQPDYPEWPAIVRKKKDSGLLGQNLTEITELKYEGISYLGDNLYVTESKGKKGLVASNGKILAGNYLDEILPQSEKYLPCRQDNKWGYLFNTGKMMLIPSYQEAGPFYKNLALVKLDGKWGVINKQGRLVLKNEFVEVKYLSDNKRRLISPSRTIEVTEKGIIKQID